MEIFPDKPVWVVGPSALAHVYAGREGGLVLTACGQAGPYRERVAEQGPAPARSCGLCRLELEKLKNGGGSWHT